MALALVTPLPRGRLSGVADDAAEWTGEKLQKLIFDYNTVAGRLLAKARTFQAWQAIAASSGNLAGAATWAAYSQRAAMLWTEARRRKDWIYEFAYYTGTDAWESQGPAITAMVRKAQAAGLNRQPLGALPAVAGLAAVMAAMVVALRWLSHEDNKLAHSGRADALRSTEKGALLETAKDPKQPAEIRQGSMAILGEYTEALATQTPDLGTQRSNAGSFILPLALVGLVLLGGKKLL
jgi:hypothetical protein